MRIRTLRSPRRQQTKRPRAHGLLIYRPSGYRDYLKLEQSIAIAPSVLYLCRRREGRAARIVAIGLLNESAKRSCAAARSWRPATR